MIDWLTIIIALIIIISLVGFFGFLAWKINMSDPLTRDDNNQYNDTINDNKKRKEKNSNEQQSKKKRKEQKKVKRENKDEEEKQQQRNKTLQTTEETDDEREESEQELLIVPTQTAETSKARKRNKNKPTSESPLTTTLNATNTKNSRVPPATHPKSTSKDEVESTKKPTTKKPIQKQTQQQEQPFTVVGSNRHKVTTPQTQQNKPVNTNLPITPLPSSSSPPPPPPPPTAQVPREQLPIKEKTTSVPVKQVQPKIADLIKVLPSSQVVVTELMSALDAFPLSPDELDIIMHKIANKQSVVKLDWTKLQQGQKVDPQAHIGHVLDESAKAYHDDMKNNSLKRVKELTDELNAEKRRNNDLLKEKADKEHDIQILHAKLAGAQHKHEPTTTNTQSQQKLQTLELQLQRITEDNIRLTQQLAQQQQQQQQHSVSTLTNTGDSSNLQIQVLSEQIKKLSVDNANWEKKAHSNELLAKEAQKEKDDLIRYNEQLTQTLQNAEKDLKHIEEKHHKQMNEIRTSTLHEINEYKNLIEQLEKENEQLKREEIVHVEPTTATDIQTITVNTEEREQFEKEIQQLKEKLELNEEKEREYYNLKQKLTEEIDEHKKRVDNLQTEIQRLTEQQQQVDESRKNELHTLQTELNEVKSKSKEEHEKHRQILSDLLSQDLRNQLPHDNQDFEQWFSSYRQLFETEQRNLKEESAAFKRENDQLHKNMNDIENQLKDIEKTVQSKEESLLTDLKSKDALLENIHHENEQLNSELKHLRNEIQTLKSAHDASVNEARTLKHQLDERFLVAANSPSIVAADESFELVKQPSPSLSPIVIDIRAEQLNELIRSSKEALENQDSITQQLDKHLNDMHPTGLGETAETKPDDSTVSSSSDQQS